ncbi:probable L-type lectin-domain containing receptor kinase VI.1 isoform X2 [Tripterygium wilfordii]|uniref:probable L-type lectin-domain containing receptor kinase VI.1 isoform X2 n=1 Tax=Tripterygium wilfordii TaxID=458696 RepID=UPI0018F7E627|nr:probable L-type lectin-domain containing receptor kinase VI.1 isoform X2 [Tripterygium wilfordii]XP_038720343.1 probable L-type lectin-domain containing receptor kinase VI.1 isoform X2 [Tripterygium wilfordii]
MATSWESELTLEEASIVKPNGALRLTNSTQKNVSGHAFYHQSIRMSDTNSPNASPFSTSFVFTIKTPKSGDGGHGIAFTLSPSPGFPGAEAGHYLGIFNPTNNGSASNHVFAVEFDTVNGINENSDSKGNHVGINLNSMVSVASEPASYHTSESNKEDVWLESGDPIRAWIEYDGINKVNVSISRADMVKPTIPLISHEVNLTSIVKETMYVGFSASTAAEQASSHYILGWSFVLNSTEAPPINVSMLPVIPNEENSPAYQNSTIVLISVLSSVTVLLFISGLFVLYRRRTGDECLEEWELDCPHRFRYRDLYRATKGFKDSEVVGKGGFGVVYRGVIPTSGSEIAVKKISRNSIQGLREFAAEIESLGRLRHKNLVNLQGWCKKKNDLLIVYEYIPNGSLDFLLFKPPNGLVLPWDQRFNIIKGIAAGLLYLHEEWEQVVIHRDVKSSNVLIDADMNARLSDFGLARLHDHGAFSHTTSIVGTIGYIAPELARTGKPSTSSDVFAYGVLLIEIATGRRPIDSTTFILVDWVMECKQLGQILDVVDPRLESHYSVAEMELVLKLGLLCSHNEPEARPTMRQVTRILNGEENLPVTDYSASMDSRWSGRMASRYVEAVSSDMITASHLSSSFGISSNSIDAGR